jgi:endogenous inhibitor of DNA gyrase (YacG/DUF329 family)
MELDEEHDDDERDWPDESDQDADDDPDAMTVPCPHCGADVFDEADVCPRCGNFIVHGEASSKRPSVWLLVGVIVCLAAVLLVWTRWG